VKDSPNGVQENEDSQTTSLNVGVQKKWKKKKSSPEQATKSCAVWPTAFKKKWESENKNNNKGVRKKRDSSKGHVHGGIGVDGWTNRIREILLLKNNLQW